MTNILLNVFKKKVAKARKDIFKSEEYKRARLGDCVRFSGIQLPFIPEGIDDNELIALSKYIECQPDLSSMGSGTCELRVIKNERHIK